jgi:hypothetical protein
MLPEEGATLLGMAGVARVVNSHPIQGSAGRRAVCIVAIAATHLAVANRVHGSHQGFGPLALMAIETDPGLLGDTQNRIVFGMHRMTACARDIFERMYTRMPCGPRGARMATETDLVLRGDRHVTIGAEGPDGSLGFAAAYPLCVISARPVTTFALQLRERAIRITAERMACLENRKHRIFRALVMTGETGVRTARTQWDRGRCVNLLAVDPRRYQ